MITIRNERGKQVVYIFDRRVFLLSGQSIALTPNVEIQPDKNVANWNLAYSLIIGKFDGNTQTIDFNVCAINVSFQ